MIRLRHETLPAGLSALVRRRADGDLDVIVSTALSASRRRAAVRAGLRAMQPAGRRETPLRLPALIMLALAGPWLRAIGRLLRLRPAASLAVAATATAAAVVIAAAPHLHGPAVSGGYPGAAPAPPPGATARPAAPGFATPSEPAHARPLPSAMPVAARSSTGNSPAPAASQPYPATSAPQQSPTKPTPAASVNPGGNGICVRVLGIRICVKVAASQRQARR